MTQIRELRNTRTSGLVKYFVLQILEVFNLCYIIKAQIKMGTQLSSLLT